MCLCEVPASETASVCYSSDEVCILYHRAERANTHTSSSTITSAPSPSRVDQKRPPKPTLSPSNATSSP
ncbi:unnamed protein product [Arctogadus glacialis]